MNSVVDADNMVVVTVAGDVADGASDGDGNVDGDGDDGDGGGDGDVSKVVWFLLFVRKAVIIYIYFLNYIAVQVEFYQINFNPFCSIFFNFSYFFVLFFYGYYYYYSGHN